jgi:hypothetical protein
MHPVNGEIVVATHGRSLWALDVSPLRQMNAEIVRSKAHLYTPNTVVRLKPEPAKQSMYGSGHRRFYGTNPQREAQFYYSLNEKVNNASIKIIDYAGRTLRELSGKTEPGLHIVTWNLRPGQSGPGGTGAFGTAGGGGGGGGGAGGSGRGNVGRGGGDATGAPVGPARGVQTATSAAGQPAPAAATTGQREATPPAAAESRREPSGIPLGSPSVQATSGPPRGSGPGRPEGQGSGSSRSSTQQRLPTSLAAGTYRVVLTIDGQEFVDSLKVEGDAVSGGGRIGGEDEGEEHVERSRVIIH